MKNIFFTALLAATFLGLQTNDLAAQQHKLVKLWETDSVMKIPESVLFDRGGKQLFVANIDGEPWAVDGKGSIGKVGLDGKIIAVDWVSGLNAPKGMGLYKGKLYVADVTELVVIDVKAGKIDKKIAFPEADGLNDVSIDKKGVIYVTDSRQKKIYKMVNETPTLYIDELKGPNGVLAWEDELYYLDAGGIYRKEENGEATMIADGMEGGTDGVENVKGEDFLVSCWAGRIYYVNEDGTKELLMDSSAEKKNTADIGYDRAKKIVYVPSFFKNTVAAYQLQ